jgi:hypothetical protein
MAAYQAAYGQRGAAPPRPSKAWEQDQPPLGGGGGGANLVEGVAELIVGLGLELGLGRQCLPKKISKSVP